ncbi:hypothetical protein Tco_0170393 [Tanacetum coccineum]
MNKGKQIWKPKGKLSDNSLTKTKRVWKATDKLFANVGYQWRPTGKKFALGKLCPLTKLSVKCSIVSANQQDPNRNWGTEIPNTPHSTVFKCRSYSSSEKSDLGMITFYSSKKGTVLISSSTPRHEKLDPRNSQTSSRRRG